MTYDIGKIYRFAIDGDVISVISWAWDRYDHPQMREDYPQIDLLNNTLVRIKSTHDQRHNAFIVEILNSDLYFWSTRDYLHELSPLELLAMESE